MVYRRQSSEVRDSYSRSHRLALSKPSLRDTRHILNTYLELNECDRLYGISGMDGHQSNFWFAVCHTSRYDHLHTRVYRYRRDNVAIGHGYGESLSNQRLLRLIKWSILHYRPYH